MRGLSESSKEIEMTTRKARTTSQGSITPARVKKLKVRKETVRDLDLKAGAKVVKGGRGNPGPWIKTY
jgi:hypothetical protein